MIAQLQSSAKHAFNRGEDQTAGKLLYEALELAIAEGILDETLIDWADLLAEWLSRRGNVSQAERIFTRSLQLKELAFGRSDPRVLSSLEKLVWFRSGLATRLQAQAS